MVAHEKARKWASWLPTAAVAPRLYLVKEMLAAFASCTFGFDVLTCVVPGVYFLQKARSVAAVHVIDGVRRAGRRA